MKKYSSMTDFPNGPPFSRSHDIAFLILTDAYKAFSRTQHSVWPVLGICCNIPPNQRAANWNTSVLTLVPGPKKPARVDSFLIPTIQDFEILEHRGILVWDVHLKR